jgi:hypothetical protein
LHYFQEKKKFVERFRTSKDVIYNKNGGLFFGTLEKKAKFIFNLPIFIKKLFLKNSQKGKKSL